MEYPTQGKLHAFLTTKLHGQNPIKQGNIQNTKHAIYITIILQQTFNIQRNQNPML